MVRETRMLTVAVGQEEGKLEDGKDGMYDGLDGCSVVFCDVGINWNATNKTVASYNIHHASHTNQNMECTIFQ